MQVGRVVESRTPAVPRAPVGAMTYGHRTGYVADPLVDRSCRCPPSSTRCWASTSPTWARSAPTGCCTPPPTCYGPDVRGLGDGVRGRRVAVVGAGVVALLTALFARRHGAASVLVLDPTPRRRGGG